MVTSRGSPGSFKGEVWEWIAPLVVLVALLVLFPALALGWVLLIVAAVFVFLYHTFRRRPFKERMAEKKGMRLSQAKTP
jgi:cobalamin synthase